MNYVTFDTPRSMIISPRLHSYLLTATVTSVTLHFATIKRACRRVNSLDIDFISQENTRISTMYALAPDWGKRVFVFLAS